MCACVRVCLFCTTVYHRIYSVCELCERWGEQKETKRNLRAHTHTQTHSEDVTVSRHDARNAHTKDKAGLKNRFQTTKHRRPVFPLPSCLSSLSSSSSGLTGVLLIRCGWRTEPIEMPAVCLRARQAWQINQGCLHSLFTRGTHPIAIGLGPPRAIINAPIDYQASSGFVWLVKSMPF